MNALINELTNQRLKNVMCGMSNHAAYLVRSGKNRCYFEYHAKLRRKPL